MTQTKEPVSIDGITFDALIDAEETWEADIPSYPTEEGYEVSDTVIVRPVRLSMSIYLTNTPITWRDRHGGNPFRVQDVISRLREIYMKRIPIPVRTNDRDYENMGIVKVALPTKIETGTSRLIPIAFQQIIVTKKQTSTIPASYGRGGATGVNAGTAGTASRAASGGDSTTETDGSRGTALHGIANGSGLTNGGWRFW